MTVTYHPPLDPTAFDNVPETRLVAHSGWQPFDIELWRDAKTHEPRRLYYREKSSHLYRLICHIEASDCFIDAMIQPLALRAAILDRPLTTAEKREVIDSIGLAHILAG